MTDERAAFLSAVDVSRETLQRLDAYAALLRKWNASINLVSKSTIPELWARHFLDSAQVFMASGASHGHWVDLGSGGGLPGLIVAILAAERAPNLRITLVESDLRKATFCRTVIRELGLEVDVQAERAEFLEPLDADFLSARALAPLNQLIPLTQRHLAQDGVAFFLKGRTAQQEIDESLASWCFQVEKRASLTAPDAALLILKEIARA